MERKFKQASLNFANLEIGQSIEGIFTKCVKKEVLDTKSGELKEMEIVELVDDNGTPHHLWKGSGLTQAIAYCEYNQYLRITYQGEEKSKNGNKFHKYMVEVAE